MATYTGDYLNTQGRTLLPFIQENAKLERIKKPLH